MLHLLARALGGRAAAAVAPTIAEGRAERLACCVAIDSFELVDLDSTQQDRDAGEAEARGRGWRDGTK